MGNTPKPQANKIIDEIYPTWQKLKLTKLGYVLQRVETIEAITQAMLDVLPEKHGLHIVKEMEELKEETKDLHPSSNAYREIERSKSMSMGIKVGYNKAISEMETAIKLMGEKK